MKVSLLILPTFLIFVMAFIFGLQTESKQCIQLGACGNIASQDELKDYLSSRSDLNNPK